MRLPGRGVQYVLKEFFRHPEDVKETGMEGGLEGKEVVIQGLGNVGYHAAKFLSEEDGVKITAIIERDGAIINNDGLPIGDVHQYINKHKRGQGFSQRFFCRGRFKRARKAVRYPYSSRYGGNDQSGQRLQGTGQAHL